MKPWYFVRRFLAGIITMAGIIICGLCIIWFILMLTGCKPQQLPTPRPPKEIIREYRHDSIIPGGMVRDSVPVHTYYYYTKEHPYLVRDSAGFAELRFWKDSLGRLRADCEARSRTIKDAHTEMEHSETVVPPGRSKFEEWIDGIAWYWKTLFVALTSILVADVFLSRWKKRT